MKTILMLATLGLVCAGGADLSAEDTMLALKDNLYDRNKDFKKQSKFRVEKEKKSVTCDENSCSLPEGDEASEVQETKTSK